MPSKVTGDNSNPLPQPRESGTIDRYGVHSITRVEKVPADLFTSLILAPGTTHPRFTSMAISRATYSLMHGGRFYEVSYLYEGFVGSLPEPTYELGSATSDEPIETHVDFTSTLAGTPAVPKNGAIFIDPETGEISTDNAVGVFQEFGPGSLLGVLSYREKAATWTKVSFATSRPTALGTLGEISAPEGPAPSLTGRDWMLIEDSYRKRGFVYEQRKTWELSGRNGWNTLLY